MEVLSIGSIRLDLSTGISSIVNFHRSICRGCSLDISLMGRILSLRVVIRLRMSVLIAVGAWLSAVIVLSSAVPNGRLRWD